MNGHPMGHTLHVGTHVVVRVAAIRHVGVDMRHIVGHAGHIVL